MNSLALMAFGTGVEKFLGSKKMALFYVVCGLFAVYAQYLFSLNSSDIILGASGAISGLFGGIVYIIKKQQSHFNLLAIIVLWIVFSIIQALFYGALENGAIAFVAHIAGFLAGLFLMPLFVKKSAVN